MSSLLPRGETYEYLSINKLTLANFNLLAEYAVYFDRMTVDGMEEPREHQTHDGTHEKCTKDKILDPSVWILDRHGHMRANKNNQH